MGIWTNIKRGAKDAPARYRDYEHRRLRAEIEDREANTERILEEIEFKKSLRRGAPSFKEKQVSGSPSGRGPYDLKTFVWEFTQEYTDEGRREVYEKWLRKLMYGDKRKRDQAISMLNKALHKYLEGEEV